MSELEDIASFFDIDERVNAGEAFYPAPLDVELVNEADSAGVEQEALPDQPALGELKRFEQPERVVDLTAIDTGTILIGSTERGAIVAVKGAVVVQQGGTYSLVKLGPKLQYLDRDNAIPLLEKIGEGLGRADLYVKEEGGVKSLRTPSVAMKHFQDRIRNYVERKLQRFAVQQTEGGIVLFDGALEAMEWDTPLPYLEGTRELAFEEGNSLVGISKRSDLQVDGVNVSYLLQETQEPCFRKIEEPELGVYSRRIGETFVARFGPGGFSFRTDVRPFIVTPEEILNRLYRSVLMMLGYPVLLKLAHIHSVFTKREVVELQVLAARKYGLKLQRPQDVSILFAPFRRAIQ